MITEATITLGHVAELMAHAPSLPVRLLCIAALDPKASSKIKTAALGRLVSSYNIYKASQGAQAEAIYGMLEEIQ